MAVTNSLATPACVHLRVGFSFVPSIPRASFGGVKGNTDIKSKSEVRGVG